MGRHPNPSTGGSNYPNSLQQARPPGFLRIKLAFARETVKIREGFRQWTKEQQWALEENGQQWSLECRQEK